jgi:hypothetical protein
VAQTEPEVSAGTQLVPDKDTPQLLQRLAPSPFAALHFGHILVLATVPSRLPDEPPDATLRYGRNARNLVGGLLGVSKALTLFTTPVIYL